MNGTVVICTYRVKTGCADAFAGLLTEHGSLLRRLGLAVGHAPQHFRREDEQGRAEFVEIFEWRDVEAASAAHENAEVASLWGRMGELVEARDGRPKWQFPHYERLELG